MKIKNTNFSISSNIADTDIVLISDLHYNSKNNIKVLNNVLDQIKKISPEFICIPGDLIDKSEILDEDELISWLVKLANISKVILSLGNHEFYINRSKGEFGLNKEFYKKIKNIDNLYFLDNTSVKFNNINFIGLTLPIEHFIKESHQEFPIKEYSKFIKSDKECYNIVLCHSPLSIINVAHKLNVDLILCGHTHGGVVPFFLRKVFRGSGFISPSKTLFPKNCYGLIKRGKTNIVITSGITILSNLNKFNKFNRFFSSEIVNIKIKKTTKIECS